MTLNIGSESVKFLLEGEWNRTFPPKPYRLIRRSSGLATDAALSWRGPRSITWDIHLQCSLRCWLIAQSYWTLSNLSQYLLFSPMPPRTLRNQPKRTSYCERPPFALCMIMGWIKIFNEDISHSWGEVFVRILLPLRRRVFCSLFFV